MILVTVGMHPMGFERLVRKMDEIAVELEEEVIIQIGGTKYVPRNAKYFNFATEQKMRELCQTAMIVVTHGGVGSILVSLECGSPVIVVPRLKKYGEVVDDHQLYLVRELEKAAKVVAVYNVEQLGIALKEVSRNPIRLEKDRRLINALKGYIAQFEQSSLD